MSARAEINRNEAVARDQQPVLVDEVAVDAPDLTSQLGEGAQPCALTAAHIDHCPGLDQVRHERGDHTSRAQTAVVDPVEEFARVGLHWPRLCFFSQGRYDPPRSIVFARLKG